MEPVKIIVEIRGGAVVAAYAANAEWLLLDHDNINAGDQPPNPACCDDWQPAAASSDGWHACRMALASHAALVDGEEED